MADRVMDDAEYLRRLKLLRPRQGKRAPLERDLPGSSVLDVPIGGTKRIPDTVLRRRPEPEDTITGISPSMAERHAEKLAGYLTPKIGGPRAQTVAQTLLGGQESVLPFGIGAQELVPFSPYVGEQAGAMVREGAETGSPLTTGLGLGLGALQAYPVFKPIAKGVQAGAMAAGRAGERLAERVVPQVMERGGLGAEMLGAMGTGTRSPLDVWHGSPHKFDPEPGAPLGQFRAEKIGSGEGAQAYGHGLYTAEAQEVGEGYRKALASPEYQMPSGNVFSKKDLIDKFGFEPRQAAQIIEALDKNEGNAIEAAKVIRGNAKAHLFGSTQHTRMNQAADFLLNFEKLNKVESPGYLYKADLPDEMIPKMLDWDKPLSQQPEVQKALRGTDYEVGISEKEAQKIADERLRGEADEWAEMTGGDPVDYINNVDWEKYVDNVRKESGGIDSSLTGKDLHRMIMRDEGYRPELFDSENYQIGTSEMLRGFGIPGIKYLDATSRNAGKGTRNFVIFPGEEKKLRILQRNEEKLPEKAEGGLVQDTDALVQRLIQSGMSEEEAMTQALRMAGAREEARMAGGGIAKALKGAKKTIGNYQALPLQLPRAPALSAQEIAKTAERVARQQTGHHVRKPGKTENLAGRSAKEVHQLQKMPYEIESMRTPDPDVVVPEELGQVRIALPGDITLADKILLSVDDLPIGSIQEGGPMYGAGKQIPEDPRFWASGKDVAQIFQNKVTDLANVFETPEILAQHMAMGPQATNFAQHFADANLKAIQAAIPHPKAVDRFNKIIREGFVTKNPKTGERVQVTFPDFPGVENYEEAYDAMRKNPEMRKWFNDRMKKGDITEPLNFPSGKQIEYAIMEPELRNMEIGMSGLSVGRMKPGEGLRLSTHKTYSHDIPGVSLGRSRELVPTELAFPDASAHIRATKPAGSFTPTMQKLFPHQVVDEQYINELGEYYNKLRNIRGFKDGGAVGPEGAEDFIAQVQKKIASTKKMSNQNGHAVSR